MPVPTPNFAAEIGQFVKLFAAFGGTQKAEDLLAQEGSALTGRVAAGVIGRTPIYKPLLDFAREKVPYLTANNISMVGGEPIIARTANTAKSYFGKDNTFVHSLTGQLVTNAAARFAVDVGTTVAARKAVKLYDQTPLYKRHESARMQQLTNIVIGSTSSSLIGGITSEFYQSPSLRAAMTSTNPDLLPRFGENIRRMGEYQHGQQGAATYGSAIGGLAAYTVLNAHKTPKQRVRQAATTAGSRLVVNAYLASRKNHPAGGYAQDNDPYGNIYRIMDLPPN